MTDMDLAVALARAAGDSQLAVGGVTAPAPGSGGDYLRSLIDAFAYAAEVLDADLDEIFDEAFIETAYDRGQDILRAQFSADLQPVVCVVIDPGNVYVATVGGQTGDSSVRFGDGSHGERPPAGFEHVGAVYRDGEGGGALELVGLALGEPIWLIAVTRGRRPLFCRVDCHRTRGDV